MDWSLNVNPETNVLTLSASGPWDMDQGAAAQSAGWARQARDGIRRVLWDLREVTASHVSSAQIRELAARLLRNRPALPEGRAALVTARDFEFGLGRMIEAFLTQGPVDVQVFRDLDEAVQWLTSED